MRLMRLVRAQRGDAWRAAWKMAVCRSRRVEGTGWGRGGSVGTGSLLPPTTRGQALVLGGMLLRPHVPGACDSCVWSAGGWSQGLRGRVAVKPPSRVAAAAVAVVLLPAVAGPEPAVAPRVPEPTGGRLEGSGSGGSPCRAAASRRASSCSSCMACCAAKWSSRPPSRVDGVLPRCWPPGGDLPVSPPDLVGCGAPSDDMTRSPSL
mmetsp:Transcript_13404/g.28666  ORF Transcript_13404/g.28666 Transcript_13404/m.28666 type:complete len:206 (-) Transcript_13404:1438-2055(-)